jgi:hypothetical protein
MYPVYAAQSLWIILCGWEAGWFHEKESNDWTAIGVSTKTLPRYLTFIHCTEETGCIRGRDSYKKARRSPSWNDFLYPLSTRRRQISAIRNSNNIQTTSSLKDSPPTSKMQFSTLTIAAMALLSGLVAAAPQTAPAPLPCPANSVICGFELLDSRHGKSAPMLDPLSSGFPRDFTHC